MAIQLLIAWMLIGCGLESFANLEGPKADEIRLPFGTSHIVEFEHNEESNNGEEFQGYRIYYKLYNNSSTSNTIDNDRSVIDREPVNRDPSRLDSRGYRQIIANNNATVPTIPIASSQRDAQFTITIDLSNNEATGSTAYWPNTSVALYRNTIDESSNNFKRFPNESAPDKLQDEFSARDDDADENIVSAIGGGEFYVALYAIAVGIDNTFQPLFSQPVFLIYEEYGN